MRKYESAIQVLEFQDFAIDLTSERVLRDSEAIPLRPQSFKVLSYLVENRDRLVSKDELMTAVWGEAIVTDDSITQCLVDIRKALGPKGRHLLRTVPRRGYKFDGMPQANSEPKRPALTGRRGLWITACMSLALVAISAAFWLSFSPFAPEKVAGTVSNRTPVAAVLPFEDFSQNQELTYLGYGIAEETLNRLVLISGLQVVARTSSFAIAKRKGLDVRTLKEILGATHVIEGSVRKQGELLRVTAQLIDTNTGYHLWSQSFDVGSHELLRLQDLIASSIAQILQLKIDRTDGTEYEISPEDYNAYLQASYSLATGTRTHLTEVEQQLNNVIASNPMHLPSASKLLTVYQRQFARGHIDAITAQERIVNLTNRFKDNPDADLVRHTALGELALNVLNDLPRAAEHLSIALAHPGPPPVTLRAGGELARALRRHELAISLYQAALATDPLCSMCRISLVYAYLSAGKLNHAESAAQEFMKLSQGGHFSLALINTLQGKYQEASRVLATPVPPASHRYLAYYQSLLDYAQGRIASYEQAVRSFEQQYGDTEAVRIAQLHSFGGSQAAANRWTGIAAKTNLGQLLHSLTEPTWNNAMDDQGFIEILTEMGRAPEQLSTIEFDPGHP